MREIVQGKDGCYFKGEKIEMEGKREGERAVTEFFKILLQFWGHKRPQSAPHVLLQQRGLGACGPGLARLFSVPLGCALRSFLAAL